ncbi:helix-turn-helix transcriptional regulator [Gordonia soli]|uniref:Putative LuxR family transcriptional regulator n=1 Tax=Gordonia soli NBRC 108243 TaxID=1223545 RepID=M0QL21_9ACTN|nr:LuxR family transcriptional regulator [Gordonia soli]GAC68117.1 putative LuxR family transcriptional regulator [Gordonia soli NBRC 108243]
MSAVLAGRRREFVSALRRRVDAVAATGGGGGCVVVTAEAGGGKSHSLRAAAAESPVTVSWATASELSWRKPYSVVGDLLGVEVPDPLPPDADRLFLERLDRLVALGPHVFVVDDAHHADAASLATMALIADVARMLPVALIVARRPEPVREYLVRLAARPDVETVVVPPLDGMDVDVLVHERLAAWPGTRLRSALATTGGHPLSAQTMLDDLGRRELLIRDADGVDIPMGVDAASAPTLAESVEARLDPVGSGARDVLLRLAVWGGPAALEDLAALVAVPAAAVVAPVQELLEADLVAFDDHGRLEVTHDTIADAVCERTARPLRDVVHRAIADFVGESDPVARAHHLRAAGAEPGETVVAVQAAARRLETVPAVAADVLAGGAGPFGGAGVAAEATALSVERALALARSGQLAQADEVARDALSVAGDVDAIARLIRVRMFALTVRGARDEVLEMIEETLTFPLPEVSRRIITDHRSYVRLLGGAGPIPLEPYVDTVGELSLTGLVAEALRSCLTGATFAAVEYAAEASRRFMTEEASDSSEGASADLWPPFIEMYHRGPKAAAESRLEMARRQADRGTGWQGTYHQLISGSIELLRGNLADSVAIYDAAFEKVATGEEAVSSLAYGGRAMIDVMTGDLAGAEHRVQLWDDDRIGYGHLLHQFGIPQIARVRMLTAEARRSHRTAAHLAGEVWSGAMSQHCFSWAAMVAPEIVRIAIRAVDEDLVTQVAADLATLPRPLGPATTDAVRLAEAMASAEPSAVVEVASDVARRATRTEDFALIVSGWEEAAVAAAVDGRKTEAIDHARAALRTVEDAGADGWRSRILSRMRGAGVRVTTSGTRRRPDTGWDSLTPTEAQVTELVALGLSGPDIAGRLFMSPRTVQTHVSHVLGKLGLRTRVELAAAASGREPRLVR